MEPARLMLLGDFELRSATEVTPVSPSAQRLLAHLAVVHRGHRVRRGALAERLWPEVDHARAASNLRSVLWRLPRLRGRPLVRCDSTYVALHPELRVDLWDAEELAVRVSVDEPPAGGLTEVEPLRRDLLPDWHDDWLVVERESFRQKRLHALERCAEALCRRGHYTEALSVGLGAVQAEPLRESAHRRVIEVHLAEGNQAEALRQYDGYRRMLAEELGLPPSPAIRGLVAPLLGRPVERRRRSG